MSWSVDVIEETNSVDAVKALENKVESTEFKLQQPDASSEAYLEARLAIEAVRTIFDGDVFENHEKVSRIHIGGHAQPNHEGGWGESINIDITFKS